MSRFRRILSETWFITIVLLAGVLVNVWLYMDRNNIESPVTLQQTNTCPEASGLLSQDRFTDALAASELCIKARPDAFDGWIHKGMALYRLGRCADSLAAIYHAMQMDVSTEDADFAQNLFSSISNSSMCAT